MPRFCSSASFTASSIESRRATSPGCVATVCGGLLHGKAEADRLLLPGSGHLLAESGHHRGHDKSGRDDGISGARRLKQTHY